MKAPKRIIKFFIEFIIALILDLLLARFIYINSQKEFPAARCLCDSSFVISVFLYFASLMSFFSKKGLFNAFGYTLKKIKLILYRKKETLESYTDYTNSKTNETNFPLEEVINATIFLLTAFVCLGLL